MKVKIETADGATLSKRIARLQRDATQYANRGQGVEWLAQFVSDALRNILGYSGVIISDGVVNHVVGLPGFEKK